MSKRQKAGLLAALLGATMLGQGLGRAQDSTVDATTVSAALETGAEIDTSGLLDDATLDAMTSPIALYPDTLLGQVLVATTYPLDVLKADRFLTANAKMSEKDRVAAVDAQDWPDSVKSLSAGFPELIGRMAEHSDWTEVMGAALVVQTDDVLASIQRLRAQAKVNGYLEDNAAMNVETDPETEAITIASADPNVVYVPEYTNVVYTQPAPVVPYYVYDNDNDNYWGDALVTGAVIWGTAVIIDNIFDNDWDNGWDNGYWHGNGGGNSIDWDGDINIDNGINIGNGNAIGSGNRPEIGAGNTIIGGDKITGIDKSKITDIDRSKIGDVDLGSISDRAQVGAVDQDRLDRARDANFNPTAADRDAARAKIAAKEASGKGVSTLPAAKGVANGAKEYAPAATTKLATKPATKPSAKPAPSKPAKATAATRPSAPVSKPKAPSKPSKPKPSAKAPVYEPQGGSRAGAAAKRGQSSRGGR